MTREEFGALIKGKRERLGLYPKQVAELAGCAETTVREYERGMHEVSMYIGARILKALGMTIMLGADVDPDEMGLAYNILMNPTDEDEVEWAIGIAVSLLEMVTGGKNEQGK